MALLLDALALEVGMDPTKFRKGQVEVSAALRKTREAAQKEGAGIERAVDKAGESLERLARNALKLFAIFTTGRAVKDFVADITASDAALGRLAKSLETTPQALSALGGAVSRSGGSADAAANSFQRLANSYNELKLTGRSATYDMLSRISGATGKVIRYGRDTQRTLYDIADAAKAMSEQSGVSFTTNILEQAGLDPGTISLLIQGSEKMREAQEKVKRLGGVVSKQDTENAQRFSTALHDVGTISEGLGRTIWTNLSPAISEIIEKIIKWYEVNGEWLRSEIAEKVKMLADYLRSIDWEAIGTGIKEFASGANEAAKAVGGWKVVFEALLGAWLFTKLLALLRVLGLIRLAITGSATPGLFGSVLGALGIGGTAVVGAAVGTAVGADVAVPNAAKPGVTNHWDDEASGAAGAAGMGSLFRRGGRWLKRKLGYGGGSGSGSGRAFSGKVDLSDADPQVVAYIREAAKKRGIDPETALAVADGEGLRGFGPNKAVKGDDNTSHGPFQMHYAGGTGANRQPGLGDDFTRQTGLDARDPGTWKQQVDFSLDHAKKNGWQAWYGRAHHGIGVWDGINGASGAPVAARASSQGVDPRLTNILNEAAKSLPEGYRSEVISGFRPGDSRFHGQGLATDIAIYDKSGQKLGNYQDPSTFRTYEKFAQAAREAQMKMHPELAKDFRWGGYFGGPRGKYGAMDTMHFDLGGSRVGMGGGSWAKGLTDEQRRLFPGAESRGMKADDQAAIRAEAVQAGARAAVAQANVASSVVASRTSNDNRNTDNRRYDETHLHNVNVYPATGTQSAIMAELKQAAKGGKAFAAEADYGKA